MARHTSPPPIRPAALPTLDQVRAADDAERQKALRTALGATEQPDAPKGRPAGPARPGGRPAGPGGPGGHPAEKPRARPPAAPVKPGKPGKDVKPATPANGPRIEPGPGHPSANGRKRPATGPARRNGHILPRPITTTGRAYHGLDSAFRYFNATLFGGRLPECVITLQRKKGSAGYFAHGRFADVKAAADDASAHVDEIAMNPTEFKGGTERDVLSTLVHEMTHVEQYHFGEPSRPGYHNEEWAGLMARVGLMASDTGKPGGKMTGQKMTHYVIEGGAFDKAYTTFLKSGGTVILYGDRWLSDDDKVKVKKKAASKTKYTCPCCGMNAWAKPDVRINCGECEEELEAEPAKD